MDAFGSIFRLFKQCVIVIETLQRRSHQAFMTRVSEESIVLKENGSKHSRARGLLNEKPSSIDKDRSVLIVDDEKNIRLTLAQALKVLDISIDTAANGEEALLKLNEKEFDLLLLDLSMPGVDGMEVLRRVKEIRPGTRVIVLSAYLTPQVTEDAIAHGATATIPKPLVPEEIRDAVRRTVWA